jgi:hypothetical protein
MTVSCPQTVFFEALPEHFWPTLFFNDLNDPGSGDFGHERVFEQVSGREVLADHMSGLPPTRDFDGTRG